MSDLAWFADRHDETKRLVAERYAKRNLPRVLPEHFRQSPPDGAVLHVPASGGGVDLDDVELCWRFMRSGHKTSTNFVIGWPTGRTLCPVPPERRAWHAGDAGNGRIGIDLCSPGPIVEIGSQWYRQGTEKRAGVRGAWIHWLGKWHMQAPCSGPDGAPITGADAIRWPSKPYPFRQQCWHIITPHQIQALVQLIRRLDAVWPMDPARIVRHSDLSKGRSDPGPCVPLGAVRRALRGDTAVDAALSMAVDAWPASGDAWRDVLVKSWETDRE